jgi:hypothetical protein
MAKKEENNETFDQVIRMLNESFGNKYNVKRHENLVKASRADQIGIESAIRGKNAFQTDISITKRDIKDTPMVVVELKTGTNKFTPTTNDVILYSARSAKHKSVFPQIRYGMIWFNGKKVPNRFILNNENMDFAFGFSDDIISNEKDREIFLEMLREQLKTAEDTLKLLEKRKTTASMFSSIIRYE